MKSHVSSCPEVRLSPLELCLQKQGPALGPLTAEQVVVLAAVAYLLVIAIIPDHSLLAFRVFRDLWFLVPNNDSFILKLGGFLKPQGNGSGSKNIKAVISPIQV